MLGTQNTAWQRDFLRHGSGVRWCGTKRPGTPLASRGQMHQRRTIGLNIPRQVASPQSPTPFLQAPLAYRSLGIGARSIGHRRDALKIRGSGARRQNSPENTHRFCGGAIYSYTYSIHLGSGSLCQHAILNWVSHQHKKPHLYPSAVRLQFQ